MLSLVLAVARNGVIGCDNALPWRLPADLARFKRLTLGKPVVMGRKTWESLRIRPLPGRINIVLTRQPDYLAEGARIAASLGAAIEAAGFAPDVMVIGGAEIYRQALPLASRVYLTRVEAEPAGDAFFPALDPAEWLETAREEYPADARNQHPYAFLAYARR